MGSSMAASPRASARRSGSRRVYDDDGQLLSGSMLDYAVPRASWLPDFELDETVTPSPVNPLGVKGVGEAGAIASTPAVVNAVIDALAPLGIRHLDMPLTAQTVWRAIHRRGGDPHDPGGVRLPAAGRPVEEALRILAQAASGTKVISGGQSLLPLLKLRLAPGRARWSTSAGCRSSRASGRAPTAAWSSGPPSTYREVLDSALVAERAPLLVEVIYGHRRRPGPQPGHAGRQRWRTPIPASDMPAGRPGARRR